MAIKHYTLFSLWEDFIQTIFLQNCTKREIILSFFTDKTIGIKVCKYVVSKKTTFLISVSCTRMYCRNFGSTVVLRAIKWDDFKLGAGVTKYMKFIEGLQNIKMTEWSVELYQIILLLIRKKIRQLWYKLFLYDVMSEVFHLDFMGLSILQYWNLQTIDTNKIDWIKKQITFQYGQWILQQFEMPQMTVTNDKQINIVDLKWS